MSDDKSPQALLDTLQPKFTRRMPEGDNRERSVCGHCGYIAYQNPKIVAGAVAVWQGKILLCKRAIEPRRGFWTLPAGFMENGESVEEGAAREAMEEACAKLILGPLIGVYSIPRISQVQMFFRADIDGGRIGVGPESAAVQLVDWEQIPWDALAFPSVRWALHDWRAGKDQACPAPVMRTQPIDVVPYKGESPPLAD